MDAYKNKIKETFLTELKIGSEYIKNEFYEEHMDNIDAAVDEICDLSLEIMSNLTQMETFVIRKRLGVYDNGKRQTLKTVGDVTGKTHERIRQIEAKAYRRIISSINRNSYASSDNKSRMSSLTNQKDYANFNISKLNLDRRLRGMLYTKIETLYDLLSYSREDFRKMRLGITYFSQLSDKVHSLGFKFIEELTPEEKREIVASSSEEMINNSSIAWISDISKSSLWALSRENKTTIGMLKEFIENDGKINIEAVNYASSIGINIGKKEKISSLNTQVPMEELLDTNIKNIEMSTRLFNVLNNHGFKTIRDIILHTTSDFDILFHQGVKTKRELFDMIHDFGLFFANEVFVIKEYTDEISMQLNTNTADIRAIRAKLLNKYKELTTEKEELRIRTQELDKEIAAVIKKLSSMEEGISDGQSRK